MHSSVGLLAFTLSTALTIGGPAAGSCAADPEAPAAESISAGDAFMHLVEGNARFRAGQSHHPRQDASRLAQTASGQQPFATIVACSDSRVSPELLFDQGVGDLFVIRLAGNVCSPFAAGSIEYGVEHLSTPLLIVLGHSSCGAVTAVCNDAKVHGNIPALLKPIAPAAKLARAEAGSSAEPGQVVESAIRHNVNQTIADLLASSATTRDLINQGELKVVGAVYDLGTGRVDWLGPHPDQTALLSKGRPASAYTGVVGDRANGGH